MKKNQLKHLANYSAMAGAFILLNENADGQIIYHDIDPDTIIQMDGEIYYLDMDLDGAYNFRFWRGTYYNSFTEYEGTSYVKSIGLNGNGLLNNLAGDMIWTGFCDSCSSTFYEPFAMNKGLEVSSDLAFYNGSVMAFIFDNYYSGGGAGDWSPDTEDKYLGVSIELAGGDLHYGWIRCSVIDDYVLILKDYAYNSIPDEPLLTGYQIEIPDWNFAIDEGSTATGEDLHFSFNGTYNESDILSYRIICVKAGIANMFDLADAALLTSDKYLEIIPDGSTEYISSFNASSFDSDGDPIITNQAYKLFIYTITNPDLGLPSFLSVKSESVTLISETTASENIILSDISDFGDGRDLQVYFSKVDDEIPIAEYRVMLVKTPVGYTFDLTDAQAVVTGNYFSLPPDGTDHTILFNEFTTDVFGNLITFGESYHAYILSVDNGLGTGDSLSTQSNEIILNSTDAISDLNQYPFEIFALNGIIYINSINNISSQTVFNLTDAAGKTIYSRDIAETKTTIELNLPNGIYIATIYSGDKNYSKKIVIQN